MARSNATKFGTVPCTADMLVNRAADGSCTSLWVAAPDSDGASTTAGSTALSAPNRALVRFTLC